MANKQREGQIRVWGWKGEIGQLQIFLPYYNNQSQLHSQNSASLFLAERRSDSPGNEVVTVFTHSLTSDVKPDLEN